VFSYVSANKRKIITQVTDEISKKLNGKVSIGNVELSFFTHFPKVSVELHRVMITDTMYTLHHHTFFMGQNVFVNVGVMNLLSKSSFINGFRIDKGSFYLYTDTSGYTNKYLFSPKNDSAKSAGNNRGRNELKNIFLNNVRIIVDDKQKNKLWICR
jgi:hypothetical protein